MPKLLIDDVDENICNEKNKHYFNVLTKIYPIDYIYCKDYIYNHIQNKRKQKKLVHANKREILCIFLLEIFCTFVFSNTVDDGLVYIFIFLSINLFMIMIYMLMYNTVPLRLEEFEEKYNSQNLDKLYCYTCGVDLNDEFENLNDFEIIYLSCGHIHHTQCFISDYVQKYINIDNTCNYCSSSKSSNILKPKIEEAYYASILAYDFKNEEYIKKVNQLQNQVLRRSDRIKNKNNN